MSAVPRWYSFKAPVYQAVAKKDPQDTEFRKSDLLRKNKQEVKIFRRKQGRGVVVVVGAVLVQLTLGTIFTSGNLGPYLISYLRWHNSENVTSADMVWINAVQIAGQGLLMPLGGMLDRRCGPQITGLIGSFIMSSGTAITYFTVNHSYVFVLLTYGVMFGLGVSIGYISMVAVGMRWFPNNRGVVNGVTIGAFGFGAFVFNQVQTGYLNPHNTSPGNDGYFMDEALLKRVPYVFLLLGGIYALMQLTGIILLTNPGKMSIGENRDPPSMSPSEVLHTPEFYMLWLTMLLNVQAVTYFTSMYKAFGQTFIEDDRFLALVGAICAAFNAGGRIAWGILIDKFHYKFCMAALCVNVSTFLLMMQLTHYGGKPMFAAWACLLFLGLAGTYTLISTCVSHTFGPKHAGTIYGMVFSNAVAGGPITAVLTQFLSHKIGYTGMFYILAGFSTISLLITMAFHERSIATERKTAAADAPAVSPNVITDGRRTQSVQQPLEMTKL